MAFVNEYISQEDKEKYGIDELNKRWGGARASRDWTIDKEKDIWLRLFDTNFPHYSDYDSKIIPEQKPQYWDFWWKGVLMIIAIQQKEVTHSQTESCITDHLELVGLDSPECLNSYKEDLIEINIPTALINHKTELLKDLEEAIFTYESNRRKKQYFLVFDTNKTVCFYKPN